MADAKHKSKAVTALERKLQDARRERNEKLAQEMLGHDPKKLAQEMLGKNRRQSTPKPSGGPAGSLASRMGVTKRSASLPRMNSSPAIPPRGPRQPSNLGRSMTTESIPTRRNDRNLVNTLPQTSHVDLSIRGAAGGPYTIVAQNFAPGTTAADIESVLQTVGGEVTHCHLISSSPVVMAEIGFVEKAGADKVIQTFNNKRADGRILYVFYQNADGPMGADAVPQPSRGAPREVAVAHEEVMEVDQNAEERAEQNRIREQRRGREQQVPREPRSDRISNGQYNDNMYSQHGGGRQPPRGGRTDGGSGRGRFGGARSGGGLFSDRPRGGRQVA